MKNYFSIIWTGNPFKGNPIQFYFRKFGFGISLFGAKKLAIIKFVKNKEFQTIPGYEYSAKIVWSTKF